ncbi:hypothetical protein ETAA8_63120 [Anatilimnocola aggregata]|uniref:Uncharacterized protein n=1 Tax=Anatilimnocola aggregata TaxID=2528021 RepID=A0A517YLQ6_9BACT|nr:hypothetical protein [Anatilimnocola aggregata]QDU31159.1 hypothetical protein ETAA8_63120 [Anatilimnocola aggregata]
MLELLEFLLYSAVIPAITAVIVAITLRRLLPTTIGAGCSFAVGVAAGFFVGYALLPEWAPLVPERHWQWLPHLAFSAAFVGCVIGAGRWPAWSSGLLYCALGLLTAWLIVPSWVQPTRLGMIPLVTAYIAGISLFLVMLPARLRGRLFLFLLAACAASTALVVFIEVAKYGQVAVIVAPAIVACWVALLLQARLWPQPEANATESLAWATAALIPVYVLIAGGSAFVGAIEPTRPVYWLLAVPAAPLALWLFVVGPLARLTGIQAVLAQTFAVAVIPLVVVGISAMNAMATPVDSANEWSSSPPSPPSAVFVARG